MGAHNHPTTRVTEYNEGDYHPMHSSECDIDDVVEKLSDIAAQVEAGAPVETWFDYDITRADDNVERGIMISYIPLEDGNN